MIKLRGYRDLNIGDCFYYNEDMTGYVFEVVSKNEEYCVIGISCEIDRLFNHKPFLIQYELETVPVCKLTNEESFLIRMIS